MLFSIHNSEALNREEDQNSYIFQTLSNNMKM
jgi:hypothetical protein